MLVFVPCVINIGAPIARLAFVLLYQRRRCKYNRENLIVGMLRLRIFYRVASSVQAVAHVLFVKQCAGCFII